jgi:uncharacterized protein YdaT
MPWDAKSFKKHNKKLGASGSAKAASIANAVLQKSGDEGMAIAVANKRVNDMRSRGRISDKAAKRRGLDVSDPPRDVDVATR